MGWELFPSYIDTLCFFLYYPLSLTLSTLYTSYMEIPRNEESALDSIEHELYDPKKKLDDVTLHRVGGMRELNLPTSWGEDAPIIKKGEAEKGFSFGAKLLLVASVLLLAAVSFTAWRVLSSRNVVSSANIDMTADISPSIGGGEVTPLVVTLRNQNSAALQEASLTLMYKQGTGAQDEQEKIHEKRDIGLINANDYKRQDFKVTLYGSEAESRDLILKLEYKVAGSNALFSKTLITPVVLKSSPLSVTIDGPTTVSIGQSGTYSFTVKNNTATTSLPSVLQLTLPNTFTLDSSDPKPSTRGTVWALPAIDSGESKVVTLVGSLSGTQGEVATIRAIIGSQGASSNVLGVVYTSQTSDIHLQSSPLTLGVDLDSDRGVAETLRYGDKVTLMITYMNTSEVPLQNVSINLALKGDAALFKSIDPDRGYYDSIKQTIFWDKGILTDLGTLAPHAQGVVRVVIPIVLKGTNSPTLKIAVTGSGTASETNDIVATVSKTWAVQGSASVSAKTTYKNSPFQNTGPIPPQANVDTTYTMHLVVSAQNALSDTKVSFTLPVYVTWTNVVSNTAKISYDSKTRVVTWLIGALEAGKTITSDVGISVRPSQSHVGQSPALTSGIVLDADEQVSRAHIKTTISALTTFLSGENWSVDPSRVVEK